jgi:type IV secretory pathway VirB2 component (pilin)
VRRRLSSTIFLLAGAVLFVDMFLRWAPRTTRSSTSETFSIEIYKVSGWDVTPGWVAGSAVVVLVLAELAGIAGVWRSPIQRLVGFFVGAPTAVLALAAVVRLHWGSYISFKLGQFAYGAWIALGLGIVLLAAATLRLAELRSTASPPR